MSNSFNRRLDDEFLSELDRIAAWLARQGIHKANRFSQYRKNIEWLRAHDLEQDRARVYAELQRQQRLTEILSTFAESIEIVGTIPILIGAGVAVPIDLLRNAFSGPADLLRENGRSNQARNAMFELTMGAMAARRALAPVLSTSNPDIAFQFEDRRICIECKRVISESKVLERIEEGIEQLTKSVRSVTNDVGIVAISLGKLFNPGDRVAMIPQDIHPHDLLSEELRLLLRRNEQVLARVARPSVAAILFYLSSPCYVPGAGYTRATCGTVFPLNLDEQDFLHRLASNLIA